MNAANSEESSSSATKMASLAAELSLVVEEFKLEKQDKTKKPFQWALWLFILQIKTQTRIKRSN